MIFLKDIIKSNVYCYALYVVVWQIGNQVAVNYKRNWK